jgi:hypothetical protein
MSNSAFTPTVLLLSSSAAGSGQGELNLITNPTATTDTAGWSPGTGRSTGGGPLNPTVSTYFTILNTAASESSTSGAYNVLSLPSAMQNRKLKVEFYYTSPAADTFKVSVYKGSTRVPLTTDVSGSTSLPQSTTGKFTAYFDTDSSGTWTISITRTTGTGGSALQFTNVVVGPGIQPQGAAVGEWQAYTPVLKTDGATQPSLGSTGSASGRWRRVGSSIELDIFFILSGTGIVFGTGNYYIDLAPLGLTINNSALPASTGSDGSLSRGVGYAVTAANATRFSLTSDVGIAGNNQRVFWLIANSIALAASALSGTSSIIGVGVTLPVAEWFGSGNVQLAQNDVEFASNSDTSAADNTSAFSYGPGGSVIPSITAATGAPFNYSKRVTFSTPIQSGDRVQLEIQLGGTGPWIPLENLSDLYQTMRVDASSGNRWGIGYVQSAASNTIDVIFGRAGRLNSGWAGASGPNYPAVASDRWRVRKTSPGAAVGFGIVAKDQAGLLPAYNTNLDDATATRLGLKQYIYTAGSSGTPTSPTYKDGLRPTITGNQGMFAVDRGMLIPYQCQDGTWRIKFNINASFMAMTISSVVITIAGISFPAWTQYAGGGNPATNKPSVVYSQSSTNPGKITIAFGASDMSSSVYITGDFELTSAPTWAYL